MALRNRDVIVKVSGFGNTEYKYRDRPLFIRKSVPSVLKADSYRLIGTQYLPLLTGPYHWLDTLLSISVYGHRRGQAVA